MLPIIVLVMGLLMVSTIRYSHMVNRHLRGRRSIERLIVGLVILLGFIFEHRYVLGIACMAYALYGPAMYVYLKSRRRPVTPIT
jgi:phosphatidylserine synthase